VVKRVVVVGTGVIGCAIARELSIRGAACTFVDPRRAGQGATQASAGMLAPYVEAHGGGPMLDLCVRSLGLYDEWIAGVRQDGIALGGRTDIELPDYGRIGTLEIALSPDRAAALRGGHGAWLEPDAVASLVPQLAPTAGALRNELHGYVDPRQLTDTLAESAESRGVVSESARVERIDRRGGILLVDLGPDRTALEADAVVLAAGAWTNRIHGVRTPPVRPVRGQLLLHWGDVGRIPAILWGPDCYIVPRRYPAQLMIGATVEDAGFDERPTEDAREQLFEAAQRLLPGLTRDGIHEVRVGLRPATPDELPVIGDDPSEPGVFHASGHYRNGILLAPITAQLIADLVLDNRRDSCLDHFRVDRF
jgi:glycine oxidase ThiO